MPSYNFAHKYNGGFDVDTLTDFNALGDYGDDSVLDTSRCTRSWTDQAIEP